MTNVHDLIATAQKTDSVSDELGEYLMKLAAEIAGHHNWRGYSYVDEWAADAVVDLLSAVYKVDLTKHHNPEPYLARVVVNRFREKVRGKYRRQAHIGDHAHISTIPDTESPNQDDDTDHYVPVNTLRVATVTAIPQTKAGLWRSPTGEVFVFTRLTDYR